MSILTRPVDPDPPVSTVGGRPRPAGPLAVASLSFGAVGVLLGATLVWFFLALPCGLAAIGCGIAERRATRRSEAQPASGVVTAGLVAGSVAVLLSVGGLLVIPRIEGFVDRTIELTQADVRDDLDSVERSFRSSVDALDRTLTDNVNTSTRSLSEDFRGLERSSRSELERLERQLDETVASVEASTSTDLSELERSVRDDLRELERVTTADLAVALERLDRLERQLAELQDLLAQSSSRPG